MLLKHQVHQQLYNNDYHSVCYKHLPKNTEHYLLLPYITMTTALCLLYTLTPSITNPSGTSLVDDIIYLDFTGPHG